MTADKEKTLNSVLAGLQLPPVAMDKDIKDLTLDSRKVTGGELFIAVPGVTSDGRNYIAAALKKGAVAVLVEGSDSEQFDILEHDFAFNDNVFLVPGLKDYVGILADRFYRHPSQRLKVMGVTGTNGKTSCCWFISEILRLLREPCALMGTVGRGFPGDLESSLNTTSDVVSLHQYLDQLASELIPSLAMEVSSHGLDQGRVDAVVFEVALFTHISRDHLDYHGTLEAYVAAKAKLFSQCQYRFAVIGKDDNFSDLMIGACPAGSNITTWSLEDASADVFLSGIQVLSEGFSANLHTPWGSGRLNTSLLGHFNLENLLAVIASLGTQGYSIDKILAAIPDITTPPGRMQRFGGGDAPLVLVDYAHTPDAIESVLTSLYEHSRALSFLDGCSIQAQNNEQIAGRVICVYGCGGDRDRGKRPLMTNAALNGADLAVLTSDNPRTENPEQIIADAQVGVSVQGHSRLTIIADRATAIHSTIISANADDIIVIAGKGHENYQEINGVRHHFDDTEEVIAALQSRNNSSINDTCTEREC